jgi:hypothetical protein
MGQKYRRLADASLRLAACGINLSHPPSCVIPLGGGSPFLCGSSCDSSAQTISCSFQVPVHKGSLIAMQNPVKERIVKLREEIAQISEANRQYLHGGKKKLSGAAGDHARRLQRLQDILDELMSLTDWKKL